MTISRHIKFGSAGKLDNLDNITILKHFKLHGKFARFANTYISDMASWNLSWLKLKTYPKANWVGENTMAYMRIQSYLYGLFLESTMVPKEKTQLRCRQLQKRTGPVVPHPGPLMKLGA